MATYREDYLGAQAELLEKISDPEKYNKKYFEKNDIKIKTLKKGNVTYVKLKYEDQCKFGRKWQYACRGSTFVIDNGKTTPFFSVNKFFNSHEFEKYYGFDFNHMIKNLTKQGFKFLFMPKYDGTNVQCFTEKFNIRHRLTLGSLDKNNVGQSESSYDELAEQILKNSYPKLYEFLDQNPGISVVCELLSQYNVIRTRYTLPNSIGELKPLLLIGTNGIPSWEQFELLCNDFKVDNGETIPVNSWKFSIDDFEIVKKFAFSEMVENSRKYGENPEGLVAYAYNATECFPIAKFKRPEYFEYIDPSESFPKLQSLKINGQLDDHELNAIQSDHIQKFEKYLEITGKMFDELEFLKSFLPQKEFARNVTSLCNDLRIYSAPLFTIRKKGFEFTNGYSLVIDLLKLETKGKTFLQSFQEENGNNWFEVYLPK